MNTKIERTCRRRALKISLLLLAAIGNASIAQAVQRIVQIPENGVISQSIQSHTGSGSLLLAATLNRVCQANARWIRLDFKQLNLGPYDSLTLVSSEGDRITFDGDRWSNRAFSTRALRGACVDIQPSFGNPASQYQLDSYQYGTRALDATSTVVAGAGDICDSTGNVCKGTSDLIVTINPTAVFTAGDAVYEDGTLSEYNSNYDPTWGRFKSATSPVPGNHDYNTSGASGYFDYFNGVGVQTGPAGDRSKGYYSWDVGDWHFIALNTMSGSSIASAQITWLKSDLAATTKPCVAAYFHHPLMSIGNYAGGYATVQPIWDALYAAKADLILNGHDHNYQRYAKLSASKHAATDGIREILVGTGGRAFYSFTTTDPNIEASDDGTHGILKLTLTSTGYTGDFVPSDGNEFTDHFTGTCNAKTSNPPPAGPTASFSFTTSQLTAAFTDSSTDSGATIASRSWTFGDGGTSTATNPSHAYTVAGSYAVNLTVTDSNNKSSSKSQTVTVTASPPSKPVANFSDVVNGLSVAFTDSSTDSGGTIASRSWNFGDGNTSTATSPSHTYAAAGTYSVSLTVTDNTGATNTKTQSVTVSSGSTGGLQNGVAVSGLSGAKNAKLNYTVNIPAGASNLTIAITGSTSSSNDADLYVKFGSAPTTSSYDCRPYKTGSNESCAVSSPQTGTYYIMLNGYSAFSGVSLKASWTN